MRTIFFIIGILFVTQILSQENKFIVISKFAQLPPGKHKLNFRFIITPKTDTLFYSDTIDAEKNTVIIRGNIEKETLATLSIRKVGVIDFALGPGDSVNILFPYPKLLDSFIITGSQRTKNMVNYVYNIFRRQSSELRNRKTQLDSVILNKANKETINKFKQDYNTAYEDYFHFNTNFADTVNSSTAVFYALFRYLSDSGKYNVYPNIEKARIKFGNSAIIESLMLGYKTRIVANDSTYFKVGDILPITKVFDDSYAKNIKKIATKSKLLLIDFWASWCGPCQKEFPFLNKAYMEYAVKGFDIVSISFDKKKDDWKEALNKLAPKWENQFINNKVWEAREILKLNIKSIPRNFLIDASGKIYGKDLRGTELIEILNRLL